MQRLGMKEGEVMEHKWLNRSVETAQRRVEQQHFAVRKRTLEYDDVMNRQRSVVYGLRSRVLTGDAASVHNLILDVMHDLVLNQAERWLFDNKDGNLEEFMNYLAVTFPVTVSEDELRPLMGTPAAAAEAVMKRVEEAYETKCAGEDQEVLPYMERGVFLQVIDREWQDYLRAMDDLRHGVNLRAYGQRDPLVEYKKEAFGMFETLMATIKAKVAAGEFRCATATRLQQFLNVSQARAATNREEFEDGDEEEPGAQAPAPAESRSVADVFASMMSSAPRMRDPAGAAPAAAGRNDPCPCGSGKKFKKCCGRNAL
jgi:preprotein translocase subunit SecA